MSTHTGVAAPPGTERDAKTAPPHGRLSLEGLHPAVSALLATVSVLVALLVAVDVRSPARQLLVVVFLLTVPGATLIRLLRFESLLFQCCVACAVSVVIDMLVALGMLELDLWRPASAVVLLAGASAVLSVVPHLRTERVTGVGAATGASAQPGDALDDGGDDG